MAGAAPILCVEIRRFGDTPVESKWKNRRGRKRPLEGGPKQSSHSSAAGIESPSDIQNIGTLIRNVNALSAEKVCVVDPRKSLPDNWKEMPERKPLARTSVSAVNWSFVKRLDSTDDCFDHLEQNNFHSVVTFPRIKGQRNIWLHKGDFTEHTKLAVWFGIEKRGISDRAVERSDACDAIAMFGMIDSLNLGTSSGIVLYKVTKQRRDYQNRYRKGRRKGIRADTLPAVMARVAD